MATEPRYWLWRIMIGRNFGEGFGRQQWSKMLEYGVAAQDYGERDYQSDKYRIARKRNINKLKSVKQGDFVIAGLGKHRFAGYGEITSDFYENGPSFKIKKNGYTFAFEQRHDCNWTALPLENGEPRSIDCRDLKNEDGIDIDFNVGLCVKEINKKSFDAIKKRLDAGAEPHIPIKGKTTLITKDEWDRVVSEDAKAAQGRSNNELINRLEKASKEPETRDVSGKQYKRNQDVVEYTKRRAEGKCQLCGQPGPFKDKDGNLFLEVHHIIWLSRNGNDCIENAVALCPNCHRRMHIMDLKEEKEKLRVIAQKDMSEVIM